LEAPIVESNFGFGGCKRTAK